MSHIRVRQTLNFNMLCWVGQDLKEKEEEKKSGTSKQCHLSIFLFLLLFG